MGFDIKNNTEMLNMIKQLNDYITTNNKNWGKWIIREDGYPTLDFENIWNGTGWSKE